MKYYQWISKLLAPISFLVWHQLSYFYREDLKCFIQKLKSCLRTHKTQKEIQLFCSAADYLSMPVFFYFKLTQLTCFPEVLAKHAYFPYTIHGVNPDPLLANCQFCASRVARGFFVTLAGWKLAPFVPRYWSAWPHILKPLQVGDLSPRTMTKISQFLKSCLLRSSTNELIFKDLCIPNG